MIHWIKGVIQGVKNKRMKPYTVTSALIKLERPSIMNQMKDNQVIWQKIWGNYNYIQVNLGDVNKGISL